MIRRGLGPLGIGHSPFFFATWDFTIVGVEPGESPLVLDITGDGNRVDLYELTVAVVEDACAIERHRSTCDE